MVTVMRFLKHPVVRKVAVAVLLVVVEVLGAKEKSRKKT